MPVQQHSEQIKLFTNSPVMARVAQEKVKSSFPRLTVTIAKEAPREHPEFTNAVIITGIYDACVELLTDLVVPFAVQIKAVLYITFDEDPAGNTNSCYDWSQDN